MTLLVPALLATAALCLVLLVLHTLRRRDIPVGSVLLWRQLEGAGTRSTPRRQMPKWSVPLVLQLAAVLLAALGLAQPLLGPMSTPEHRIHILEGGPGMMLRDGSGTRFERSLSEMKALLAGADPATIPHISVILAGATPLPIVARQPPRPGLLEAEAASLSAGLAPVDWQGTAQLVAAIALPGETTRIVLHGDGPAGGLGAIAGTREASLHRLAPAAALANAALAARLDPDGEPQGGRHPYRLSGEVTAVGTGLPPEVVVRYLPTGGSTPIEWTRVALGPGSGGEGSSAARFSARLELPGPGVLSAGIAPDALDADNSADFVLREQTGLFDILYIGTGNQPVLRALRAIPGTTIYEADGLPGDVGRFRLVVIDDVAVARRPETNVLWIGSGRIAGAPDPEARAPGPVLRWDRMHPLSRGADWGSLAPGQALPASPGDGTWLPLVETASQPLVSARTGPHGRDVALHFQPGLTDWPATPALPAFAGALVDWIGHFGTDPVAPRCIVGAPCRIPAELLGAEPQPAADTAPAGGPSDREAGSFVPAVPGLHTTTLGQRRWQVAVEMPPMPLPAPPTASEPLPGPPMRLAGWLVLATLLVVALETWVAGRGPDRFLTRAGLSSANPLAPRRRTSLALRIATLGLLLAAALNLPLAVPTNAVNSIVIAADLQAAPAATGGVHLSALPVIAAPEEAAPPAFGADVETALHLGAALLPADAPGRLQLVTATRQSVGEAGRAVPRLLGRSIAVDTTLLPAAAGDVAVADAAVPSRLYAGDEFALGAVVAAPAALSGTLAVSRDGEVLVEQPATLAAGFNRVAVDLPPAPEGEAVYALRFTAEGDSEPANDLAAIATHVGAAPRLLILAPAVAGTETLAGLLDGQGFEATVREARRAPWRLDDYLEYDLVILADVPAIQLDTRQQELIREAVVEHGRGLLILGGPNSFGPGGYLETPLDDMSPLSSKVPREAPETALAFVLDRSGSMGQRVGPSTRLDVAKQATLAAARLIGEKSRLAVVAFNSVAQVVAPLQPAAESAIAEALSRIDSGGGTAIVPGLAEGLAQLEDVTAPARHIVLMTDGLSEPGPLAEVLARIASAGITVSTVAIGEGADGAALQAIATASGGSFHRTRDFRALPSILSQEAMLLSGTPVEEGRAQPRWTQRLARFAQGQPAELPPVHGFVLTTAKPEAEVSAVVPDAEGQWMPLLASWRYGNGHVLALATQGAGAWTRDWLAGPDLARLYADAVRQFLPAGRTTGLDLHLAEAGDTVRVEVDLRDGAGLPLDAAPPRATLQSPSGNAALAIPLTESGPGRFSGTFLTPAAGTYRVQVEAGEDRVSGAFEKSYSALLAPAPADPSLANIAAATGGRMLAPGEAPSPEAPLRWLAIAGWPFWLGAALLLFMAELLLRHGGLGRRRTVPREGVN